MTDTADTPKTPTAEEPSPAGIEAARFELPTAGYCVLCDRIVTRAADGTCPHGHPAVAVSGRLDVRPGEEPPQLPRFNLAAFALPPIWGPAHGQWVGAIFLPLWLFADSAIRSAGEGGAAAAGAVVITVVTLAAQFWFARRANGLAWRRVCEHVGIAQFAARQRVWAVAATPVGVALLGWAVWYDITSGAIAR